MLPDQFGFLPADQPGGLLVAVNNDTGFRLSEKYAVPGLLKEFAVALRTRPEFQVGQLAVRDIAQQLHHHLRVAMFIPGGNIGDTPEIGLPAVDDYVRFKFVDSAVFETFLDNTGRSTPRPVLINGKALPAEDIRLRKPTRNSR